MPDKFKKNKTCEYCEKPLEAKYRSKRFCSGKCRVYFSRENKSDFDKLVDKIWAVKTLLGLSNLEKSLKENTTFSIQERNLLGEHTKRAKQKIT